MFDSNESISTVALERFWLCVTNQVQNGTYFRISQHSSWLLLQSGTQRYGKVPSQSVGRHTDKTNREGNTSLSRFADGRPKVSGNSCPQFCQQKFCLGKTHAKSQQICVCLYKLHVWVFGLSCQSWPVCSVRGR